MCRAGLHDLNDPANAEFTGNGRMCGPCNDARPKAPRPYISRARLGPPKRFAPKPIKPHLCKNGHDLDAVGLFGRRCNVCRVSPRTCKAGHLMVGAANPGRSGCRVCDNLRKRMRDHLKRARRHGSVVLNTKATGWRALIDGQQCVYCWFCPATTLDHVVPLARGGEHSLNNLAPACAGCNSHKRDLLLSEWAGRVCPGCEWPASGDDLFPLTPRAREYGGVAS
jgi:hypothetical protein